MSSENPSFVLPSPDKKGRYVQTLFKRVAPYYDVMNDLMTLGMHRLWKKEACAALNLSLDTTEPLLDVCTGTGDLLFYLQKRYPQATLTGIDFCQDMLDLAQKRLTQSDKSATLIQGDAMALPFEDKRFSGAIISYGLRNVADYSLCLKELHRVLTPGATLVILDMSHPVGAMNSLSAFYRFSVVPLMGKCFTGESNAYQYLTNSIFNYPTQKELVELLTSAGFSSARYTNKLGGVCAIHTAQK